MSSFNTLFIPQLIKLPNVNTGNGDTLNIETSNSVGNQLNINNQGLINFVGGISSTTSLNQGTINLEYSSNNTGFTTLNIVNSSWTTSISQIYSKWSSVIWNEDLNQYTAVSWTSSGQPLDSIVMNSSDGITWTTARGTTVSNWNSVCWSSKLQKYVSVSANSNNVMTSSNGITWTSAITIVTSGTYNSVIWNNDLEQFCAVGNTIVTSEDGLSWTTTYFSTGLNNNFSSIVWSHELLKYVIVESNSNRVLNSTDSKTWTSYSASTLANWKSVTWSSELNLFCAVSATTSSQTASIMTSSNGITWTSSIPTTAAEWNSVVWSPQLKMFLAVGNGGTSSENQFSIMYSNTGTGTWNTVVSSTTKNNWYSVDWSPSLSQFVAVAFDPIQIQRSFNNFTTNVFNKTITLGSLASDVNIKGKTLQILNNSNNISMNDVSTNNLTITSGENGVNIGNNSYIDSYHTNLESETTIIGSELYNATLQGKNINIIGTDISLGEYSNDIEFGVIRGEFVKNLPNSVLSKKTVELGTDELSVVRTNVFEKIYNTTLGFTTVINIKSIAYSSELDLFCGISNISNPNILLTNNGIIWSTISFLTNIDFNSIIYNSVLNKFIVVGNSSLVINSSNGISWTTYSLESSNNWKSLVYSSDLNLNVAVGVDKVMKSTNGINWQTTSNLTGNWSSVTWSSYLGVFCAINDQSSLIISYDGDNWTTVNIGVSNNWTGITWLEVPQIFCVVADSLTENVITFANFTSFTTYTLNSRFTGLIDVPQINSIVLSNNFYGIYTSGINSVTWISNNISFNTSYGTWGNNMFLSINKNGSVVSTNKINSFEKNINIGTIDASETVISGKSTKIGYKSDNIVIGNYGSTVNIGPSDDLSFDSAVNIGVNNNLSENSSFGINSLTDVQNIAVSTLYLGYSDITFGGIAWSPKLNVFCGVNNTGVANGTRLSTDGINWTTYTNTGITAISITWSPELEIFCILTNTSTTLISSDGINWTSSTYPTPNGNFVSWSKDLMLFLGTGITAPQISSSSDGINWTTRWTDASAVPQSSIWCSPLLKYVVVNSNTTPSSFILNSSDAINWYTYSCPNKGWTGITYSEELSLFAASCFNGETEAIMTSTDGMIWTTRSTPSSVSGSGYNRVIWGSGLSMFLASSGRGTDYMYIISKDGINWSSPPSASDPQFTTRSLNQIGYSPELNIFCIISSAGAFPVQKNQTRLSMVTGSNFPNMNTKNNIGTIANSETTIKNKNLTISGADVNIGKYSNNVIFGPSLEGTKIEGSIKLNNNTTLGTYYDKIGNTQLREIQNLAVTTITLLNNDLSPSVVWSNRLEVFVACGLNLVRISSDGITWVSTTVTGNWQKIIYSEELALFVMSNGTSPYSLAISTNGTSWTTVTDTPAFGVYGMCWAKELSIFCAVSVGAQRNLISSDGIRWTTYNTGISMGQFVAWSPDLSLFCSSDSSTTILTSRNGITWTTRTNVGIVMSDGVWSSEFNKFFISSSNFGAGCVISSSNGVTWTTQSTNLLTLASIVWSPQLSMLYAGGNSSNPMFFSRDGIIWNRINTTTSNFSGLTWSPKLNMFVATTNSSSYPRTLVSNGTIFPKINKENTIGNSISSNLIINSKTTNIGNTADSVFIGRNADNIYINNNLLTRNCAYQANPTTISVSTSVIVYGNNMYTNSPVFTTIGPFTNGGYSFTTVNGGKFYAPVNGLYQVSFTVFSVASDSIVGLYKNTIPINSISVKTGVNYSRTLPTTLVYLRTSDYVEVRTISGNITSTVYGNFSAIKIDY